MFTGQPPGIDPAVVRVKQLEFEIEDAWKRMATRRAQAERVYLDLLKARRAGGASDEAFAQWQAFQAQYAAARAEHERLHAELLRAVRSAQGAIAASLRSEKDAGPGG